jgi:apolipoprotein N-acyltransferase
VRQHAGTTRLSRPVGLLLAAVFGTVTMLSFAPAGAWWLTPCCLAGLFMLLPAGGPRGAGLLGLAFGLGWLGSGVWWLYPGLSSYSDAGRPLALVLTLVLACYLALFPALATAAFAMLAARRPGRMAAGAWRWCTGASLWMLSEWLRANLGGGFPWLLSGSAHAAGPLGALAPWAGVLGVGWVQAFLALALADCLPRLHAQPERDARRSAALGLTAALGLAALACVLAPLHHWTVPDSRHLALRLIQGNVPQYRKMSLDGLAEAAQRYATLADEGAADLTLMPETALPVAWDAMPAAVLAQWREIAHARGSTLVIGTFGAHEGRRIGTNSAVALLPQGTGSRYDYRYDKVHLVPFGERTWPWSAWLTDRMYRRFGDLAPGTPAQPPLVLPQGRVALGICFESLFDVVTADKARDAGLLVNLTNFGWFDGSYAAAQHLQAGQMRARETGRWFVQVGNSGGTAIAGPDGVLRAQLPDQAAAVLDARVELMHGATPFMRFGNLPMLVASLAVLLYVGANGFGLARAARAPALH